jgi:hypothetical protein
MQLRMRPASARTEAVDFLVLVAMTGTPSAAPRVGTVLAT